MRIVLSVVFLGVILSALIALPSCNDRRSDRPVAVGKPTEIKHNGLEKPVPVTDDSERPKRKNEPREPRTTAFSEVEIDNQYKDYLLAQPLLMEVAGAKILRLENGSQVVLAVASTVLKEKSPQERLRAERVCRIRAIASLVGEKQGVQVAHVERLEEKAVIVLDGEKETGKSVSDLLQIAQTKVEGITRDMPVIGRWKSREGDVFYLAIGMIVDGKGNPIQDKADE